MTSTMWSSRSPIASPCKKAGVPTEMHLYAEGGHAFGLRPTSLPIGRWPQLVEQWLHTIGMLGR